MLHDGDALGVELAQRVLDLLAERRAVEGGIVVVGGLDRPGDREGDRRTAAQRQIAILAFGDSGRCLRSVMPCTAPRAALAPTASRLFRQRWRVLDREGPARAPKVSLEEGICRTAAWYFALGHLQPPGGLSGQKSARPGIVPTTNSEIQR